MVHQPENEFILPNGNYPELLSYQKAEVVFDITFRFCQRFESRGDRTVDQMLQAARSGKQNIAEGSKAAGTSKETEVKLVSLIVTNMNQGRTLSSQTSRSLLPGFAGRRAGDEGPSCVSRKGR